MSVKRRGYQWLSKCLAALLVLALPLIGLAQQLPPPEASYIDADPAAERIARLSPDSDEQRERLERALQRDPRSAVLRLQSAELLFDRGLRARVARELAAAKRLASGESAIRRRVHFNAGWLLFRMGDFEGARAEWIEAWRLHGGAPEWVPIAFALALWSQGDRDTAIEYYRAAMRARPGAWDSAESVEASAAALGANERFALQTMRQVVADTLTGG